jgi:hypothetical protein
MKRAKLADYAIYLTQDAQPGLAWLEISLPGSKPAALPLSERRTGTGLE